MAAGWVGPGDRVTLVVAASVGIIAARADGMIGAGHGIGANILMAGALLALDQLVAGVAMLSVLGLAEKRFLRRRG